MLPESPDLPEPPLQTTQTTDISNLSNVAPLPTAPAVESRTREYLSNERTYLSWMRTAISLLGVAVILARVRGARPPLSASPGTSWRLGLIFAIVGVITVFLATQHYLAIRQEIADDSGQTTGRWVILLSLTVLLLGSAIMYYTLTF
jgi:putative membrane protein